MSRYELHYVSRAGGHIGPYYDLQEARMDAHARLSGCPSMLAIDIRQGVGGAIVETVRRCKECDKPAISHFGGICLDCLGI